MSEGGVRGKLSILDQVEVATPCGESWDRMTGDARIRHCAKCDLDVFNLSELTRADAEALLRGRLGAGRMCVRLYKRADGTVITQDCPAARGPGREWGAGGNAPGSSDPARIRRRLARIGAIAVGLLLAAIGFGMRGRGESAKLDPSSPGSRVQQWLNASWRAATPTPVPPSSYAVQGGALPQMWAPPTMSVPTQPTHAKNKQASTP